MAVVRRWLAREGGGAEQFEQGGHDLEIQVTQRQLGVILVRKGHFDAAYQIFDAIAHAPMLQSPVDQARIFAVFSELFWALDQLEEGNRYYQRAAALCQQFGLQRQARVLHAVLTRYPAAADLVTGSAG